MQVRHELGRGPQNDPRHQKKLEVVPANTKMSARIKEIPAWDSLEANHKERYSRQIAEMVCAAFGRMISVTRVSELILSADEKQFKKLVVV